MRVLFLLIFTVILNSFAYISTANEHSLNFKKINPKHYHHKFKYDSYLIDGYEYNDVNGKNIVIFCESGPRNSGNNKEIVGNHCLNSEKIFEKSAEIFVYHFIDRDGLLELITKTYDSIKNCPFDMYIGFVKNSFKITDLNKNGVFEFSFLYKLSCRSDITPSTLKLIMYEMKNKYAVRGKTKVIINSNTKETIGGHIAVDKNLPHYPKEFADFSINRWKEYVNEVDFDQF